MRLIYVLVCAAALTACAATGVKVTEDHLRSLKTGETTVADVTSRFGPPTTRLVNPDGTVVLLYVYGETKVRAASYVPIVGLFAGGADTRSNTATLRFDQAGKLLAVSSSESQYGTGVGASSGNLTPGEVPQPRQP